MTTLGTRLYTLFNGQLAGSDEFGNRYYRRSQRRMGMKQKRWVIYKGADEASSVPPDWHAWLHHLTDAPPSEQPLPRHAWQQPHEPNHTGTAEAYRPPGHALAGGRRAPATGDYEPWRPE